MLVSMSGKCISVGGKPRVFAAVRRCSSFSKTREISAAQKLQKAFKLGAIETAGTSERRALTAL
jgi:hypothetical protein